MFGITLLYLRSTIKKRTQSATLITWACVIFQAANTVVQDLEVELMKTQSDLDAAKRDNEALNDTKQCLKAKLNDCSKKLVNTVSKYEEKSKALDALEQKYNELEKV